MSIDSLANYGLILNDKIRQLPKKFVYQRDSEVEKVLRQFETAKNPSFILVGPSGIGKTAILLQALQKFLVRKPTWQILQTSSTELLRGTKYIGEWETRVAEMATAASIDNNAIVYVTDITSLPHSGKTEKSDENMALSLKPYFEQDKLFMIGECDEDLYVKCLQTNPWFEKFFTIIRVNELTAEQNQQIVQEYCAGETEKLRIQHQNEVVVDGIVQETLNEMGRNFFPGKIAPSGAIQVFDRMLSDLRKRFETGKLRGVYHCERDDVVDAIHQLTGMPTLLFDDNQPLNIESTRKFFEAGIIGQPRAINTIVDLIMLIKSGLNDPEKPLGTLMFVGPTGVGKTELAKQLAKFIFGSEKRLIRLDMSEYKDYHSFEKLIGTSNIDKTDHMGGQLLQTISREPFNVILLDEIEKAHPNIFDLFLQLFDDGRLSDAHGNTVSFTQTVIVMTSNLGSDLSAKSPIGFNESESSFDEDLVLKEIQKFFRPELLNRIGQIVPFVPLSKADIQKIAQRELGQVLIRSGITRRKLRVDVEPGVVEILADAGFHPKYGARPLKRAVEKLALVPIARKIVGLKSDQRPSLLRLVPQGDRIGLNLVYDRQTWNSSTLNLKVRTKDPIDGSKQKLSITQIGSKLDELDSLVDELVELYYARNMAARKSELVDAAAEVDFWDEPEQARNQLTELFQLESLSDGIFKLVNQNRELPAEYEKIKKEKSESRLKRFFEKQRDLRRQAEILFYAVHCENELDQSDAFVVLSAIDDQKKDMIHKMSKMYLNWAERKGFDAKVVHEELFDSDHVKQAILMIEGVAVYGILKREHGIHECVYSNRSHEHRDTQFVTSRVLPIENRVAPPEIVLKFEKSKQAGALIEKHRLKTRVEGKQSGIHMTFSNDLERGEMQELAEEYVNSELWYRNSAANMKATETVEAIRRFILEPNQQAKDLRTGVTIHNLKDLWNGKIDEFLLSLIS